MLGHKISPKILNNILTSVKIFMDKHINFNFQGTLVSLPSWDEDRTGAGWCSRWCPPPCPWPPPCAAAWRAGWCARACWRGWRAPPSGWRAGTRGSGSRRPSRQPSPWCPGAAASCSSALGGVFDNFDIDESHFAQCSEKALNMRIHCINHLFKHK